MPGFFRRLFSRKTLVLFVIVAAVLGTLLALLIVEENWRGRGAWDAYRTAAEKRGVKLFLTDFIPPAIPDSENYAAVPLIREMFQKPWDNPFALPPFHHPKAIEFHEDRIANLDAWQAFFIKNDLLKEKTGDPARDILRALERFEPALQQLRDAGARPRCKFPTRWEEGHAAHLRHLGPLQLAAYHFALRMNAYLALGDSATAYGEFRHALRIRDALASEPTNLLGLVRIPMLSRALQAIRYGLAAGRWTDGDLRAIERDLGRIHPLEEFLFAASSERGMINQSMYRSATDADAEPVPALYPHGWIFQSMVPINEHFDAALAPFARSPEAKPIEFVPQSESSTDSFYEAVRRGSFFTRIRYVYLGLMWPNLEPAQVKHLIAHTLVQQTRLGCALERFRQANGAFPESLDDLIPEFIPSVPKDVCDGKPLRYRRNTDAGYDLWSIGSNRADDGGKTEKDKPLDEQPDWLWHMPGRP